MTQPLYQQTPLAIGGVGGSGTRLVANLVAQSGCYLGDTLNEATDNLWFTVLLRRSEWFCKFPTEPAINIAVDLFQQAMTTGLAKGCSPMQSQLLDHIEADLAGRDDPDALMLTPPLASLRISAGSDSARAPRWGWKEPNTHILLPQLAARIQGLKYIHVIRNGLDMAFSANQRQLTNWGSYILGPDHHDPDQSLPQRSLTYWLAANRRATELGQTLFKDRFLLLNYDHLCQDPDLVLPQLFSFLGSETGRAEARNLIAPKTIGRHQDHDLSLFSPAAIKATQELMAMA